MSEIEDKLEEMGLSLPETPIAVANYVPALVIGDMVYLSGHIPRNTDGSFVTGKLGEDYSVEQGYEVARRVALTLISSLKAVSGDLDNIKRIIRVTCMVNAIPTFTQHSAIANGVSDLLVALWGESGMHTRVAVGMGSLPGGVPVEIEMIAELFHRP
ncbi:RidA family protein [SAR202 cluster bacterium AC-647-N09_OGT_505m]|nr:RidA family protein [SAR202 cluster bacterium AC-647-N09_OGT_505m]